MTPRFLGLDLAWSDANPSGLAALDAAGRVIELRADLRSDADVLAWVRAHRGPCGAIAIDMPTIVRNPTGRRACEAELARAYHRNDAGPYPANTSLKPFAGGGRAAKLLAALAADGVVHTCAVAPADARLVAFETFPHPASVELFGLRTILRYKKKRGRSWPDVLAAWASYRAGLAALADGDPPLRCGDALPVTAQTRGYKALDDAIDAVMCAYVASLVWRYGSASPRVRVFGDDVDGHIVVPRGPARLNEHQAGTLLAT